MPEALAARMEAAIGSEWVSTPPVSASALFDRLQPAVVVCPRNEEQIAAVLRVAGEMKAAVGVRGAGTKMSWGGPLTHAAVGIDTRGLRDGFRHDHEDLVASAPAGLGWAAVQNLLGRRGQWIPLDPPFPAQATLGGVVAAGASGPRRMYYGAVRDLIIGARAVLADGRVITAGGRVIKNVAGYDLCKVLTGSLGSLAVITEATWKVAPRPESRAALRAAFADFDAAHRSGLQILRSVLQPAVVQITWPAGPRASRPVLEAVVEGPAGTVARQVRDLQGLIDLSDPAEPAQIDGPEPAAAFEEPPASGHPVDPPANGSDLTPRIRIGVPAARLADAQPMIAKELQAYGAWPERADLASGLCWWILTDDVDRAGSAQADAVARLDAGLADWGGYATVESGPHGLRRDMAARQRRHLTLSNRLKSAFDPHNLMSPGRFG